MSADEIERREIKLPRITFITVQRSTKMKPLIDKVYDWASRWVAENRDYRLGEHYYWTEPVKRLLYKLEHVKRGFIGLVGLQGSGKTTALLELYWKLKAQKPDHVFIDFWDDKSHKFWSNVSNLKGKFRYMRGRDTETADEFEKEPKTLFIDMGDYSKAARSSMNKHLDQIRDLWLRTRKYNVTILVSIQKEMFSGHFLFGKIDAVELEPLKPSQLVQAYKGFSETAEPFTEQALSLLAQLSRGIFRRFMKYIQTCIEKHQSMRVEGLIDTDLVNETITLDQLAKDMALELSDIFKRVGQKLEAVKLLDFLRQSGEANQKQIAEGIGVSESTVSRLMRKLEAHGYVFRKREAHGEWIVRLKW